MRRPLSACALALFLSQLLLVRPAGAAVFPDVPDGHQYREPIEALASLKVVTGYPDGTFHPEKSVNRAEMLALLYRATVKTPDAKKKGCFADVQPGSWYELTVCDAAARGYVSGYGDGSFRPQKEVNRVEALKMLSLVFDLPVPELSDGTQANVPYTDVSLSAWYSKYLSHALTLGILPIAGMHAQLFTPNAPLQRGEAAALILRAMQHKSGVVSSQAPSASSAPTGAATTSVSSRKKAVIIEGPKPKAVTLPLKEGGVFDKKKTVSYSFSVTSSLLLDVHAALSSQSSGEISCRLYKLESDGFSTEYYLGMQLKSECTLRTRVSPGNYLIEVQPTVADASFDVEAAPSTAKGDGNDGFSEAKLLTSGMPKSDVVDVGDTGDWYTFRLTKETSTMLELTNAHLLSCLVYPMADVDLVGFSGPTCNAIFAFPPGTYVVGVMHKQNRESQQSYSLRLQ